MSSTMNRFAHSDMGALMTRVAELIEAVPIALIVQQMDGKLDLIVPAGAGRQTEIIEMLSEMNWPETMRKAKLDVRP